MNELFSLKGQVALVTGSTMGIGEATARTLARAGAHVVVSSRDHTGLEPNSRVKARRFSRKRSYS